MPCVRAGLLLAIVLVAPLAVEARQTSPSIDIAGAWVAFPDDGTVNETLIGGAARWHVSPRLSIGPEVVYIQGTSHDHLVVTGNLVFDFRPARSMQPFLVVGGGMFQTHEEFFDDAVTSREGAFTAGGGVRAPITDRVSVGVDARIGWEPHIRIGGFVTLRLGR
jgi:hypothetical protein